jgi:hypothetical protein
LWLLGHPTARNGRTIYSIIGRHMFFLLERPKRSWKGIDVSRSFTGGHEGAVRRIWNQVGCLRKETKRWCRLIEFQLIGIISLFQSSPWRIARIWNIWAAPSTKWFFSTQRIRNYATHHTGAHQTMPFAEDFVKVLGIQLVGKNTMAWRSSSWYSWSVYWSYWLMAVLVWCSFSAQECLVTAGTSATWLSTCVWWAWQWRHFIQSQFEQTKFRSYHVGIQKKRSGCWVTSCHGKRIQQEKEVGNENRNGIEWYKKNYTKKSALPVVSCRGHPCVTER